MGLFLTAFWGFPFLDKLSWTASVDWIPLKLFKDLLPGEIRPYAAVGVLGMAYALAKKDKRTIPMFWTVIAVVVLFYTLPTGRLWNGRLLPFLYLMVFMWAAYAAAWLVRPFVVMVRDLLAAPASLSRRLYAPVLGNRPGGHRRSGRNHRLRLGPVELLRIRGQGVLAAVRRDQRLHRQPAPRGVSCGSTTRNWTSSGPRGSSS